MTESISLVDRKVPSSQTSLNPHQLSAIFLISLSLSFKLGVAREFIHTCASTLCLPKSAWFEQILAAWNPAEVHLREEKPESPTDNVMAGSEKNQHSSKVLNEKYKYWL